MHDRLPAVWSAGESGYFTWIAASVCKLWSGYPRKMRPVPAVLCCLFLCLSRPAAAQQTSPHTGSAAQTGSDGVAERTLSGIIIDSDGALVPGARVTLSTEHSRLQRSTSTGADGHFLFRRVEAGRFTLTITANGMAGVSTAGMLNPDESLELPPIALGAPQATIDVEVTPLSQQEIAEQQMKQEEKQRVLGLVPNFYVTYDWKAAPLTSKQKYKLALRSIIDPATFIIVGGLAGSEQADDSFSGYGRGPAAYGKRYGAGLADTSIGAILGGAVLPSLFHQDPRYFYKGTGSVRSRILYALSTAVIARGDNGNWQPAYAGILGDYGAGAISNLYYPSGNRGLKLTLENGSIAVVTDGLQNLVQEFLLKKISSGVKVFGKPQTQP